MYHPTDVSLLWDAIRSSWNSTARLCAARKVAGLRQSKHVLNGMMASYQTVRRFKGWSDRKKVRAYLPRARMMTERMKSAHAELRLQALSSVQKASLNAQESMVAMAEKLMDQVTRRLLRGEKIPQEEKIFSVFEPHTRCRRKVVSIKRTKLGRRNRPSKRLVGYIPASSRRSIIWNMMA